MKLAYVAWDKTGQQKTDVVEAATVADATESLRRKGLYVTEISKAGAGGAAGSHSTARNVSGRRLKCIAMFMRQLHVLVFSGTPLVQSLEALERQAREGPWRDAIGDVRSHVEEGESLAEAMGCQPEYFDSPCRSLVAAGESSGRLAEMLDRLSTMAQKQMHIRSSVIGATIYPCLLLVVATSVLLLLLLFVVPRFAALFATLGVPLPATTRALLWVSGVLKSYWWGLLACLAGLTVALKSYLGTASGRRCIDTIVLRMPQLGRITRSFATARIARLLGVLLDSDVPILEALDLTTASIGNTHYVELMRKSRDSVMRGDTIGLAFRDTDLISPYVYETIRNGEQTGQLGTMLVNIANFLDEENEVIVRSLTSIIEPVILVVMGLLVGLVALSMFTPLFDLTSMAGG